MSLTLDRPTSDHTIVVGVDGSNASVRALVWAFRKAVEDDLDVEVLTAWPAHRAVMIREVPGHFNDARHHAVVAQRRVVSQAESTVMRRPRLSERLENSPPLEALLAASSTSHMLVVGSGHARHHRFGVGSPRLVDQCYDDASCSVTVVDEGGAVHQRPGRAVGSRRSTHPRAARR